MKAKTLIFIFVIFVFGIGPCTLGWASDQGVERQAPHTFAHDLLDLESEISIVSPEKYQLLNSIILEALRIHYDPNADDREQAEELLRSIDQILSRHNFLQPRPEELPDTFSQAFMPKQLTKQELDLRLEDEANRRRKDYIDYSKPIYYVDCDLVSFIYMAVAEQMGIDLRMVEVPDHNFVRWHFSEVEYINWDTVYGKQVYDYEYKIKFAIRKRQIDQRVYMKSMTREETLGFFYLLRSSLHATPEGQLSDYLKSLSMYPQGTNIKNALAKYYVMQEGVSRWDIEDAVALSMQAVSEKPYKASYWTTLACAYAAKGDFRKARAFQEEAVAKVASPEQKENFRLLLKFFRRHKTCLDVKRQATNKS